MVFKRIIQQLDKDYEEKLKGSNLPVEILEKLESILKSEITTVRGAVFYHIMNVVSKDFEHDTGNIFEEFFKNLKSQPKVVSETTKGNKYKDFIKQYLVLQQDIAENAKIENTRLSKILSREVKDFLAYEVYAIAKSRNSNIKSAFEKLYKE